ncbi:chaplin [Streptomyces chiangmaiensis]|uniref:Chaplin n=1 Tax=Streptomyces chiangmaiensis TaxID=766497 RepID=A0ABU7FPV0_9ACTN|nr:chaplin [Streptomyces chiangmaiensis]MED7825129.1 chaplin [Streptomyces chiangmaiensis]
MKRVTRNGLLVAAAASGALAGALPAHADSAADGTAAGSPGLISGNTVQLPVHVPVNVCGNTVTVVGLLNAAAGNACANQDAHGAGPRQGGAPAGGASASGVSRQSPGVLGGNSVQLPIHLPVNVSGNTVGVAGVGNAATGNTSTNTSSTHRSAPRPVVPPSARPVVALAHTGADATVPALAGGAVLVLGGTVLYRRFRAGSAR